MYVYMCVPLCAIYLCYTDLEGCAVSVVSPKSLHSSLRALLITVKL